MSEKISLDSSDNVYLLLSAFPMITTPRPLRKTTVYLG